MRFFFALIVDVSQSFYFRHDKYFAFLVILLSSVTLAQIKHTFINCLKLKGILFFNPFVPGPPSPSTGWNTHHCIVARQHFSGALTSPTMIATPLIFFPNTSPIIDQLLGLISLTSPIVKLPMIFYS